MTSGNKLIIALDVDTQEKALGLVDALKADVRFFKIGLELFSACGPGIVYAVKRTGCEVFLDLKFHDIPTTVAKAAASVTKLGAQLFNVHALGGYDMMRKTAEAVAAEAARLKISRPKILAVTVLTSMDENALKKVGIGAIIRDEVDALARLAKEAGLDGVVASPRETRMIREALGPSFLIVTPGVRPAWAGVDDQKRIATPKEAIDDGASFIVVGRPVTAAQDPAAAARRIIEEIL
jgi:orotidine-5'-phosphate decarboxylase